MGSAVPGAWRGDRRTRPPGLAVYVRIVTPVGGAEGVGGLRGDRVGRTAERVRFEGSGRARNLLAPVATPGDQLAPCVVGAGGGAQGGGRPDGTRHAAPGTRPYPP